ncbi:unnamed protein product [Acanthoscelides obtectus]|uniref:Uncharacterized protein n=1 Tax=Acanthoscelides obtectus TaxID=200917 RepID=A0A9P0LIH1_ACAOB|nr:unnamed protein product [Acanthoscelides obtectus]CAK1656579.1 hypothetical protein AOBTE_LOCUS19813 [Acanthoscelides obtectus]
MTLYRSPRTRQPRIPGCCSQYNAPVCTAADWLPAARTCVGECMWLRQSPRTSCSSQTYFAFRTFSKDDFRYREIYSGN